MKLQNPSIHVLGNIKLKRSMNRETLATQLVMSYSCCEICMVCTFTRVQVIINDTLQTVRAREWYTANIHTKTAIEEVNEFPYLSCKRTSDESCDAEIKSRLSIASQAFGMLKKIWRSGKLSLQTKLHLFKSNVLTSLLHGFHMEDDWDQR